MAHGDFVWYELLTTDPTGAAAFYHEVVGWNAQPSGMSGMDYTMLLAGEQAVGGLMQMPPQAGGMPPLWFGYVGVDDVDAAAESLVAAGGAVHRAPWTIEGVGRLAVVADPHGAVFNLVHSDMMQPSASMAPGHIGWHELQAGELEPAFTFYADQFGWTRDQALDMSPMGIYQMFRSPGAASGMPTGGMMTRLPQVPHPFWLYYFAVPDIDAAVARVQAAGGEVMNGPMEVPGGAWILQGRDPQGAIFALVAPPKAA